MFLLGLLFRHLSIYSFDRDVTCRVLAESRETSEDAYEKNQAATMTERRRTGKRIKTRVGVCSLAIPLKLANRLRSHKSWPAYHDQSWDEYANVLREKWQEVPFGGSTESTNELLKIEDAALVSKWNGLSRSETLGDRFESRGWYRKLYSPIFRGQKILDVGCGFGLDGLTFALNDAKVTLADIVESNVRVVQKLVSAMNVRADCIFLEKLATLDELHDDYDFIWSIGSLHHMPFNLARIESQYLLRRLKSRGRWVQLAYPKERWIRDGRTSFAEWGRLTDADAPWVEWYDLHKVKLLLAPAKFQTVLSFNFHHDDFNWFDLQRVD